MIKKNDDSGLKEFDWDVGSNLKQRLYLSRDTMKLMEVINNFTARVYKRENIVKTVKEEDCG